MTKSESALMQGVFIVKLVIQPLDSRKTYFLVRYH